VPVYAAMVPTSFNAAINAVFIPMVIRGSKSDIERAEQCLSVLESLISEGGWGVRGSARSRYGTGRVRA
jgi:hypothetical protein